MRRDADEVDYLDPVDEAENRDDVWANFLGQWWYAHPVTGAHYGPFECEEQAREAWRERR